MRSFPVRALFLLVLLSACGDPGPDATDADGRLDATIYKPCYADRDCPGPQLCANRPLCGNIPVCGTQATPGQVLCGCSCQSPCTPGTCSANQACSAGGCCEPASCRADGDCSPGNRCILGRCAGLGTCTLPPP